MPIIKLPSKNIVVKLPTNEMLDRLRHAGMPQALLRVRPFDTQDYIGTITSEIDYNNSPTGPVRRSITVRQQEGFLQAMLKTRQNSPYTACIAEPFSDNKAKLLTAYIMSKFIEQKPTLFPIWHTVLGLFKDKLRDKNSARKPDFLVISNIADNSSNQKIELVRDILEIYSGIPRIVVLAGGDPIRFFAEVLHLEVNYIILLSKAYRKKVT